MRSNSKANGKEKEGRAVIASSKESFSVMGLKHNLEEQSILVKIIEPGTITKKSVGGKRVPIIYYVGDEIYSSEITEFAESLKDLVFNHGKLLIVVCEKSEYNKLTELIPKTAIFRYFPRPADMEALLGTIRDCIDGKVKPMEQPHILIVDDDKTFMEILNDSLNDVYKISMIDSGAMAIQWLTNHSADLILLDYEMPGYTGPEVFSLLKKEDGMKDIPVIFLTGMQDKRSVMRVLKLGPDDYILKSVSPKTLRKKLEEHFDKRRKHENREGAE